MNVSNANLELLSGIRKPETTKHLRASNNRIARIEEDSLKFCEGLLSLDLSYNVIEKIENLFCLNHLLSLNLSHNAVTMLENIEGLVNLKQLVLSDNVIKSIFVRSPLPKLIVLDLSGNKLRHLTGLNAFPCLSTLRIDRCMLTTLSGLQKQSNLRRITVSHNAVANFEPFYLPLLSHIDITGNKITSLMCVSRFQSLVRLDISGNAVDDNGLGIHCCFNELKEFRADGTKISDPSLIVSIAPNVVIISLMFAKVSSISNVKLLLSGAKSLVCLDLRGNPINSSCYPDLEGTSYSDATREWESEEIYDAQFPESIDVRRAYRSDVLGDVDCKLAWLDGIRIPGTNQKAMPTPSKMGFQFVEEIPDTSPDDSESEGATFGNEGNRYLRDAQPMYTPAALINRAMQTELPPNYQYPPTRKIFATDSESGKSDLRKYLNLTDDEDEEDDDNDIAVIGDRRASDGDADSQVTSDSAPHDVDLQRLGIGLENGRGYGGGRPGVECLCEPVGGNGHGSTCGCGQYHGFGRVPSNGHSPGSGQCYNEQGAVNGGACGCGCGQCYNGQGVENGRGPGPGQCYYGQGVENGHATGCGCGQCGNGQSTGYTPGDGEFSDDEDNDHDFDKYSAATDLDSELFHIFESPHPVKSQYRSARNYRAEPPSDSVSRTGGGMAFWVSTSDGPPKRRPTSNIPPFRNRPHVPRGATCGHWPFNTKSSRRLPWDSEPTPSTGQQNKKTKKGKPVRGPHLPRQSNKV